MDQDKTQKVEKFHFKQYGYMDQGTRWYLKQLFTFVIMTETIFYLYDHIQDNSPNRLRQMKGQKFDFQLWLDTTFHHLGRDNLCR